MRALPRRVSLALTFIALTLATAAVPLTTVLTAEPAHHDLPAIVLVAPER